MKGMKVSVATMAFGSRWRNMIFQSPTPMARAACTYSKFRARKNSARTMPTSVVQLNRVSRNIRIQKFMVMTAETISRM